MKKPNFASITKYTILFLIALLLTVTTIVFLEGRKSKNISLWIAPASYFNEGWYYFDSDSRRQEIDSLPVRIPADKFGTARIYHKMVRSSHYCMYIDYYAHHQAVKAFFNDELIFEYAPPSNPGWLKSYRSFHNLIAIPLNRDGILCIETKASISSTAGEFGQIRIGSRDELLNRIVSERLPQFLLGAVLIVLGFILFIITAFYLRVAFDRTILYFTLLLIFLGVWQTEESRLLQFFIGFQALHWFFEYMMQPFILILSFLFIKELFINKKHPALIVLFACITLSIFTQLILQLTGIAQMTSTLFMINSMFIVVFAYILVLINLNFEFARKSVKVIFSISIALCIVSFMISSIVKHHKNFTDTILYLGIVFLFISISIFVIQKTQKQFNAVRSAEIYKKLAFLDISTGVSNQTAWYTLIENFSADGIKLDKYCMFMFDMNNLKTINDQYGHLEGDKAIRSFCECLKRAVGKSGDIYRIGGDEFICLCKNIDYTRATQIENMFDYYVKNQTESKVQFTAAHGYAFFSPSSKADFIQAQSMADKAMYENKILSKKGRS